MGILDRILEAHNRRLLMYDKEAELRCILPNIDMQKVQDLIVYYNEKLKQLPVGGDFMQIYDAIKDLLSKGIGLEEACKLVKERIDMSYELNRLHYMVGQKHNFDI